MESLPQLAGVVLEHVLEEVQPHITDMRFEGTIHSDGQELQIVLRWLKHGRMMSTTYSLPLG